MLRNTAKTLWVLVAIATVLPAAAYAGDDGGTWVETTGEAAIVGGNTAAAKAGALDQALRQAVEQVAGTIVNGISESKDFMSVRDEITSQGAGFVARYQREKTACADGTCKVTIKALVAKGKLRDKLDKLGLLVQQRGYPRVILLVSEESGGSSSSWWSKSGGANRSQIVENTLIEFLNKVPHKTGTKNCENAGNTNVGHDPVWAKDLSCWKDLPQAGRFRFVDYTSIVNSPVVRKAGGPQLSNDQAVSIAKLTDAEVALVGNATVKVVSSSGDDSGGLGAGFRLSSATLTLRAIDVSSGKVLGGATVVGQANGPNAESTNTAALQDAARLAVPQIQKVIADSWQAEQYGVRWVKLEVKGIKSYAELLKFQGLLKSGVTGVKSVQQRRMNGGSATLEVQCTSTAQALATELSSRPLGKMSVNVTRVEPGIVGLTLSE